MNWVPKIENLEGPRYLAVASAIAQAIDSGELAPGAQLPPQRDLAGHLGVTVGTITRAYSLVRKQNLVTGEVGRGTFVRDEHKDSGPRFEFRPDERDQRMIDLSCYRTPVNGLSDLVADAINDLSERAALLPLHKYPPAAGLPVQRTVAAEWLNRTGLEASSDRVLLCAGAQQAILVALSGLASFSDTILTDAATFPGFKAIANLRGLKVRGVPMDAHGMVPSALAEAVARTGARVVYLQSTLHNPCLTTMPEERRREIAAVARANNLMIIEDDATAAALAERPAPIAAFAPDHVCYISGLAKCLSPAIRIGFLVTPKAWVDVFSNLIHVMTLGTSPILGELASLLMSSNAAEQLRRRMNEETALRCAEARRIFTGQTLACHPASVHMWLQLPTPWRALDFEAAARRNGVAVVASDHFAADEETRIAPAVRVSLNAGAGEAVLGRGLNALAALLESRPYLMATIV